jgi:DUF4097 and DUF4098 domain-containing protein YvlB
MNSLKTIAAVAAIATLSGCASVSSPVGNGLLFTSIQGPVAVTTASAASKKGSACASNILGLFATGDASLKAAKANGNITTVTSVDHSSKSILSLFGTYCTIVTGE